MQKPSKNTPTPHAERNRITKTYKSGAILRLIAFHNPFTPESAAAQNEQAVRANREVFQSTCERLLAQGFLIKSEYTYMQRLPGVHVVRLPHMVVALNDWEFSLLEHEVAEPDTEKK